MQKHACQNGKVMSTIFLDVEGILEDEDLVVGEERNT